MPLRLGISCKVCLLFKDIFSGDLFFNVLIIALALAGGNLFFVISYGDFLLLNLHVIRMSFSTVFVLLYLDSETLWLQNLFFDLLSKWPLNPELIPSSQRQNGNGDWSTVDFDNLIMWFVLCIALILFLLMCIYWDREIEICFKKILRDSNVNLIMEQIKL